MVLGPECGPRGAGDSHRVRLRRRSGGVRPGGVARARPDRAIPRPLYPVILPRWFPGGGGGYKYSNKPGGIRHWLNGAEPPIREEFICLVDPDMLLFRPITSVLGEGLTRRTTSDGRLEEYVDGEGVPRFLRRSDLPDLPDRVSRGRPAGQHFGQGGAWVDTPDPRRPSWANFSKAEICGADSSCSSVTRREVDRNHAVGPVYLAAREDWTTIADRWWEFVPRVHGQYPYLLAEMFALTMGVSDLRLPFALASSYMVSDPGTMSPTEAWLWIDGIIASRGNAAVCEGANEVTLPLLTQNLGVDVPLPTTLHFCQRYSLADQLFAKRKVPHDFFRCDGEPLPLDVGALLDMLRKNPSLVEVRTAFMICNIIPMVNSALEGYKRKVCSNTSKY